MKKLIIVVLVLSLIGCATIATNKTTVTKPEPPKKEWTVNSESDYTYDGKYDPAGFAKWEEISRGFCPKGHLHVLFSNPNPPPNAIQYAELIFIKSEKGVLLIAYRYSCDGVQYVFVLDFAKSHYTQVQPKHKRSDAI